MRRQDQPHTHSDKPTKRWLLGCFALCLLALGLEGCQLRDFQCRDPEDCSSLQRCVLGRCKAPASTDGGNQDTSSQDLPPAQEQQTSEHDSAARVEAPDAHEENITPEQSAEHSRPEDSAETNTGRAGEHSPRPDGCKAEECNGQDDDCDGVVDNGVAGCVVTLPVTDLVKPFGIAIAPAHATITNPGNIVIIEQGAHRISAVTPDGTRTTLAGGTPGFTDGPAEKVLGAPKAQFHQPTHATFAPDGSLLISDSQNRRIRKLAKVTNATCGTKTNYTGLCVTTLSGDGRCTFYPNSGATLSQCYRDGTADQAQWSWPTVIRLDKDGNIYVADAFNHRIRKLAPMINGTCFSQSGYTGLCVTTIAGSGKDQQESNCRYNSSCYRDGPAMTAQMKYPVGLAFDAKGELLIGDSSNHRIRKLTEVKDTLCGQKSSFRGLCLTTIAGSGPDGRLGSYKNGDALTTARLNEPYGIDIDAKGRVYIADVKNNMIRLYDPSTGKVTTLAGDGIAGHKDGSSITAQLNMPRDLALDGKGTLYFVDTNNNKLRYLTVAP